MNRLGLGLVMNCLAFVVGCFEAAAAVAAVLAPILGFVVEIVCSLLLLIVAAVVVGFLLLLLLSLPLTSLIF